MQGLELSSEGQDPGTPLLFQRFVSGQNILDAGVDIYESCYCHIAYLSFS